MTADYAPEYGRAAGGQIRIVSKSGTRDFHGSLYEYLRNSAMNSNTWSRNLSTLTNVAAPFRYNNFGGTIGGPIWAPGMSHWFREKLFFFVAEDWIRYRYEDSTQEAVPTLNMRNGNFSDLLSPNPWYSGTHTIYDPSTCPSVGAASCVPFPNNTIPVNRLSPNGIAIINAYPLPTPGFLNGSSNFIAEAEHPINQRKETINIDILANAKNKISGRRTDAAYFRISTLRSRLGTYWQVLPPPQPDQRRQSDYHVQPHAGQRSANLLEHRRRLHPGEHLARRFQSPDSLRSDHRQLHQLPVHSAQRQRHPHKDPHGQRA